MGSMPDIVDTPICLKTENNGLWDLDFTKWQSGGGGAFAHTRTQYLK